MGTWEAPATAVCKAPSAVGVFGLVDRLGGGGGSTICTCWCLEGWEVGVVL